jgi:uncharacterized coiled-coil protein SlyX
MSLEERIVDLEVRTAYQDKLIAELDEVLGEFSTRVERLESLLKELQDSANTLPTGPADDPPPHY